MTLFLLLTFARSGRPQQAATDDLSGLSLEQLTKVVVTASGHVQSVGDAPSSVTVIKAAEIHRYGYRTLADALQTVRGFFVTNDRNYSSLGVRGFARPGDYNTRILLLVDGHRLNDNIYDQAMIGMEFPIDVDLIDRIEIVRGPVSSLYGSNALFAVVNIFTKRGRDFEGADLSTDVQSRNTKKGRITYGKTWNGVEFLLSGTFYGSRGANRLYYPEFDAPDTNSGIADHLDGDQSGSALTTISFHDLTLHAVYGTREKQIPTASFGTKFGAAGTATVDTHGYLDLRYEHTFSEWGLLARAFYDRTSYHGSYVYPSVTDPVKESPEMDFGDGRWWGTELQATRTVFGRNRVMAGFEFRNNLRQNQVAYDLNPFTPLLRDIRSSSVEAAYLQDETTLTKSLKLNAGFRFDNYGANDSSVDPRVALIYRPAAETAVKLIYGRAFRSPNDYERYYSVAPNAANASIGSEKVDTAEIVWEQQLTRSILLSTSAFSTRTKDLITQVTLDDDSQIYQNLQNVRSNGAEIEVAGHLRSATDWVASYAFQETKDSATNLLLDSSPRSLGKLNVSQVLPKQRLVASFDAQYRSRIVTATGGSVSPFALANVTLLGRRIARRGDLSASVYNLLDKQHSDPPSSADAQARIPQDGRSFRLQMTWHLGEP